VSSPTNGEPRVVALVAAFNEADVIDAVLADLARQRVETFFIDNWSTDGTFERAQAHLGRGVIGIERFPAEGATGSREKYDWSGLLRRKEELSLELDADWFIHHDADEFREGPWDGVDLRASVARVDAAGYNAIDFAVLNFRPEDDSFVPGTDPRESLRRYEMGDWWDAYQVKAWKRIPRVRPDLASKGGHEVIFPDRRIFPLRFLLLHFPIRSDAHGRRKVEIERIPRFLSAERDRGWHFQYDAKVASYLWRSEQLTDFDPVRVRIELQIHNRLVDEMRVRLGGVEEQLDEARKEADELSRALAARDRAPVSSPHADSPLELELELARREADERGRQVEDRERELAELSRSHLFLEGELARLRREPQTARERILELEQHIETLEATLRNVLGSTSWRLTAPIRRVSERLRARSSGPPAPSKDGGSTGSA
jgi:hypothetical protein